LAKARAFISADTYCSICDRSANFLGKPENETSFMATIPLGRGTTASDVGNTCAYLASEEANFLTGVDVPVDGGRCV
jgi:NAD(P)-dependent dehydrogenase (short-subunit alcohol dehydrogenase family)